MPKSCRTKSRSRSRKATPRISEPIEITLFVFENAEGETFIQYVADTDAVGMFAAEALSTAMGARPEFLGSRAIEI